MSGDAGVLRAVCDRIDALVLGHPVRVGVDGITAAGKTTFADTLATELERRGRRVIRVSLDGFHHLRSVRHRLGPMSADGYYEDAYDFGAARRDLLDPLGPGGDRRYRAAVTDLAADIVLDDPPATADPDSVVVVDGSFLQKPDLRDGWDLVLYLRATFAAAERRGAVRDAAAFGVGVDAAREAFRTRYHAAQRRYLAECDPESGADIVVDVDDPTTPRLVRPPATG